MNAESPSFRALPRSELRGRVGIVTVDRPERRNALNLQVKQELGMRLAVAS